MTGQAYYNLNAPTDSMGYAQLGQEINVKGATYKFVQAAEAIEQYSLCHVSNTGTILKSTTTLVGSADPQELVIPQFALASGEYGWAPVGPFYLREDDATAFKVLALTLCALDVKLYTNNTTAGTVDDTATTLIPGLTLTATNSAGGTVAMPCIATKRLNVNA